MLRLTLIIGFLLGALTIPMGLAAASNDAVHFPKDAVAGEALTQHVWSYMEPETEQKTEVFDVLGLFKAGQLIESSGGTVVVPETSRSLWVLIPLSIKEKHPGEWLLWIPGVVPLDLEMWLLDDSENILEYHRTGALWPFDSRPIRERYFAFPMALDVTGNFYAAFRMKLPALGHLQFFSGSMEDFLQYTAKDAVYWSFYMGLTSAMVFYSFFLFWVTRRRAFLLYGCYVSAIVVAALTGSELLHRYLWPAMGELGFQIVTAASFVSGAIASWFIAELLEVKVRNPRLWRMFRGCIGLAILFTALSFVLEIQRVSELSQAWGGVLTIFLVIVCLVRALGGSKIARLLSLGWAGQLLGIGLLVAHGGGWRPDVAWLDYSFLIGSSIEMLFFSLAIPIGLRDLILEKRKVRAKIEEVSIRYEEGLESMPRVQEGIEQLNKQLLKERQQLSLLTDRYGQARENLSQAEDKLHQAEKLASLGQLIVGVSADLGSKAQEVNDSVNGLGQALEEWIPSTEMTQAGTWRDPVDGQQTVGDIRRLFDYVKKGSSSILRMNQALEHYSAGDHHSKKAEPLGEIIEDVCLIVHGRIRQHRLEVDIEPNLLLNCRRSQVERVVANLLTNAADGINDTPPELQSDGEDGVIRVSGGLRPMDEKKWIVLEVEDSGRGISEEDRTRVLQPFMSTKSLQRGTGLGLFTADSILREHGGRLAISDSEKLGGAKISLWFPVLAPS